MARKPSRNEWRVSKAGLWTRSLGNRGVRIRLFQKRKDGVFYRSVWMPDRGEDRKCLGTADRDEADRLGKSLLSALLRDEQIELSGALPLAVLWERYRTESIPYARMSDALKADATSRAEVLLAFFGSESEVQEFTEKDQAAFVEKRLAGGIRRGSEKVTGAVRPRSVEEDLKLLSSMLKWATTVRTRNGARLLDRNPLEGVRRPGRESQRRPVATWDRYSKTRVAIQQASSAPESDSKYRKWLRLELALVLAEATGRRIGSIRNLAWEDVDLVGCAIRWKAEHDKKRREWIVPIPEALRDELKAFKVKLGGGFGGLLFPSETDPAVPVRRDVLAKWLRQAEKLAKLPKLDGSLFHAYRRAWASSRKNLPVADVAAAGGWADVGTLLKCYQQPDDATMLQVMSHSNKIVERVKTG